AVVAAPLARLVLSIRDRLPRLCEIILAGASAAEKAGLQSEGVRFLDDVLAAAPPDPSMAPTMSDEVAFWMYTSGSTGDPKAVKPVPPSRRAGAGLRGRGAIGIRADAGVFWAAKLSFSSGLGTAVASPMWVAASAAPPPDRPTPPAVLAAMRRHRPTVF